MPRAQNAHAYVNAAFLLKMNGGKVSSARICFGGISPNFIHATSTENLLIGNDLYTNETLQNTLNCLSSELNPDSVLPDASPEYRRELAVALFYKFVIGTCPSYIVKPEYVSGAGILKRPLSSGKQEYDSFKDKYPLTQNIPKYEGLIQCSGELEYVNDIAPMKNELWAAFVQATEVYALVDSVDLSDAMVTVVFFLAIFLYLIMPFRAFQACGTFSAPKIYPEPMTLCRSLWLPLLVQHQWKKYF